MSRSAVQVLPAKRVTPVPAACPAAAYLASLSAGPSRNSTRSSLKTAAFLLAGPKARIEQLPWEQLRASHMDALRARLAERYAPSSANKVLAAVRGVLKAAWRMDRMPSEAYWRAIDVPAVRGSRLPAGRALDSGELRALFAVCADNTAAGARDAAAFALMFGAGLRRAEACAIEISDYDPETGGITVLGKGNKERKAFLGEGGRAAVEGWLKWRQATGGLQQAGLVLDPSLSQALRAVARSGQGGRAITDGPEPVSDGPEPLSDGPEPGSTGLEPGSTGSGPLLCPVNKGGRILESSGMTPTALFKRLKRRAVQAGISDCSPHDLRRTFISELLDAGADIAVVQRLAGHASPDTTSRYDRRGERAQRRAASMLHVPYEAGITDAGITDASTP